MKFKVTLKDPDGVYESIEDAAKWQLSSQAEAYACELVSQEYDHDYGAQDEYITCRFIRVCHRCWCACIPTKRP